MDQPGNNHLLLRASQSPSPAYNGQHAAADRMRELLARTVHDHLVEERSAASTLQEIRLRLEAIDEASATGIATGIAATVDGLAATLDGLAATLGALDSKLTARLERLDERLDDQYDRVRAMDGKLESQTASTEETVARAVEAVTAGIVARIASLEDTVLTLAEALLRPTLFVPQPGHAAQNGRNLGRMVLNGRIAFQGETRKSCRSGAARYDGAFRHRAAPRGHRGVTGGRPPEDRATPTRSCPAACSSRRAPRG